MNIVYVNDNDLAGSRFNGHDLQVMLNNRGYQAKQFVTNKAGSNENTISMIHTPGSYFIREKCKEFESKISMHSVIYPFGELLAEREEFLQADLVHYHLIFNHFMSLHSFKKLVRIKPSIWTLHDPWALTGHCVYPVECKRFMTGCKKCPHLDRYSPLQEDRASQIWEFKKDVYKDIAPYVDIIVASQWMYNMVTKSPLGSVFKKVHIVPFGIDLELFKQRSNREEIRKRLGIKKDNFVIMFRQDPQEWKGLVYIKKMLKSLKSTKNVTILTVGYTGFLQEFNKKYQIIEHDWVHDNDLMVDLYSAADLFLMPSVAEAFGLMAIESMACSLPIIVFEGTSLPSVTFAPDCGIALKCGDTKTFVKIVSRLINEPKECQDRGKLGRELTEKHYKIESYNKQLIELYKQIYSESKKK